MQSIPGCMLYTRPRESPPCGTSRVSLHRRQMHPAFDHDTSGAASIVHSCTTFLNPRPELSSDGHGALGPTAGGRMHVLNVRAVVGTAPSRPSVRCPHTSSPVTCFRAATDSPSSPAIFRESGSAKPGRDVADSQNPPTSPDQPPLLRDSPVTRTDALLRGTSRGRRTRDGSAPAARNIRLQRHVFDGRRPSARGALRRRPRHRLREPVP